MDESLSRVLIVDDDGVIRRLLQVNFRLAGFEPVAVAMGDAALAEATARRPDAIVLDVMMPDLDGWEVLRRLREDLAIDSPVIFLSAHSREEDRERAASVGAAAYLTKPFDPGELVATVRTAIGVRAES